MRTQGQRLDAIKPECVLINYLSKYLSSIDLSTFLSSAARASTFDASPFLLKKSSIVPQGYLSHLIPLQFFFKTPSIVRLARQPHMPPNVPFLLWRLARQISLISDSVAIDFWGASTLVGLLRLV